MTPSVNRWAIYCHFFGVAVNSRLFLSISAMSGRRISANMDAIYCQFCWLNETGNESIRAAEKPRNPQKFTGNKLRITKVRTSIQVSHLYLARPPGEPVRPHPNAADRPEGKMLSVIPPASFPPSKGCGPCAAMRLSHKQERRGKNHDGGSRR